jgi:predicted chitinase
MHTANALKSGDASDTAEEAALDLIVAIKVEFERALHSNEQRPAPFLRQLAHATTG